MSSFEDLGIEHVPMESNCETVEAQIVSGVKMSEELTHRLIFIEKRTIL